MAETLAMSAAPDACWCCGEQSIPVSIGHLCDSYYCKACDVKWTRRVPDTADDKEGS